MDIFCLLISTAECPCMDVRAWTSVWISTLVWIIEDWYWHPKIMEYPCWYPWIFWNPCIDLMDSRTRVIRITHLFCYLGSTFLWGLTTLDIKTFTLSCALLIFATHEMMQSQLGGINADYITNDRKCWAMRVREGWNQCPSAKLMIDQFSRFFLEERNVEVFNTYLLVTCTNVRTIYVLAIYCDAMPCNAAHSSCISDSGKSNWTKPTSVIIRYFQRET